jgi:hypothetical protein
MRIVFISPYAVDTLPIGCCLSFQQQSVHLCRIAGFCVNSLTASGVRLGVLSHI